MEKRRFISYTGLQNDESSTKNALRADKVSFTINIYDEFFTR